jgi:hypothetical protein
MATSYELEHYFTLAAPTIVAADIDLLPNMEACFKSMGLEVQPKILGIEVSGMSGLHVPLVNNGILCFLNCD